MGTEALRIVGSQQSALRPLTVEAHLGIVHTIARRYVGLCRGALELQDLVQAGTIGLIDALRRFDPNRGVQFSSYAARWIRGQMTRCISNEGWSVRVPVNAHVARPQPMSLDTARGSQGWTLHDALAGDVPDPLELLLEVERARAARRALECLDDRERAIVEACTMGDEALPEVAQRIPSSVRAGCITRQRAHQMQECALSRMRREINSWQRSNVPAAS